MDGWKTILLNKFFFVAKMLVSGKVSNRQSTKKSVIPMVVSMMQPWNRLFCGKKVDSTEKHLSGVIRRKLWGTFAGILGGLTTLTF